MKIREEIHRHFAELHQGKMIIVRTMSYRPESSWTNCLYLEFRKSDFPLFSYPKWKEKDHEVSFDHFKYDRCSFNILDWYKGVTFYAEKIVEGITYVKVGCDYAHHGDERTYEVGDSGILILKNDGVAILQQFKDLYGRLENENK